MSRRSRSKPEVTPSDWSSDSGSEYDPEPSDGEPAFPDGTRHAGVDDELRLELQDLDEVEDVADQVEIGTSGLSEDLHLGQLEHESLGSDTDNDNDNGGRALFNGNLHSADFYINGVASLNEDDYRKKDYAEGTKKLISYPLQQFQAYCEKSLRRDWMECLRHITFRIIYYFLVWQLSQTRTASGRKKRPMRSRQSVITFWCVFRIGYEGIFHKKIDKLVDCRLVNNAIAKLTKGMKAQPRANRPMSLDDLKLQLLTTLSTTEKSFRLGEQRILSVLFLLLMAPQGSRGSSILALQYKHIQVVLVRNPEDPDGRPRLVVRFTLEFTKKYLGAKIVKTFSLPEIIYDPSLVLSPHMFLLAILFRHGAFESPELRDNPALLGTLKIQGGEPELLLGFREDILDTYIFRKTKRTVMGFQLSDDPIDLTTMCKWVSSVGVLAGFEHATIAYTLRYAAGNKMDQSVDISCQMRDSALDHAPYSNTFYNHYFARNFCADLYAVHRDAAPQTALIQQSTSHGHSVSSRRPVRLSKEQGEEVKQNDAYYQRLTRKLDKLPPRSEKHRKIFAERKSHLDSIRRLKLAQIRDEWGKKQGVIDITRQVQGEDISQSTYVRPTRPMMAAQRKMLDALDAPLVSKPDALMQRRTDAILALMAYCWAEEPIKSEVQTQRPAPPAPSELGLVLAPAQQMEMIKRSTLASSAGNVLRCFICVAKAESYGMDHEAFEDLCREFSRQGTLARHFISFHLDTSKDGDSFVCPVCQVLLIHKNHLQNHAERVHGIFTNIKFKRPATRATTQAAKKHRG